MNFSTIKIYYTLIEAQLAQSRLENEGILAKILDENLTYTIGATLMGYRLQVESENAVRAINILEKNLSFE